MDLFLKILYSLVTNFVCFLTGYLACRVCEAEKGLALRLVWHKVDKELPQNNGKYLVMCDSSDSYVTTTIFSRKHKKFNMSDDDTDTSSALKVKYWAELPEVQEANGNG